jgi:hypothetical protein
MGITLTKPDIFTGLLIGAMLPYLFSAFTIRSVGKAAMGMVAEVRRQIKDNPGILTGEVEPDYRACIRISTRASLKEMIAPGILVLSFSFRSSSLHYFWASPSDPLSWLDSCLEQSSVESKWRSQLPIRVALGTTLRNTSRVAPYSTKTDES